MFYFFQVLVRDFFEFKFSVFEIDFSSILLAPFMKKQEEKGKKDRDCLEN